MNEALQTINLASGIIPRRERQEFYSSYFQKFISDTRIKEKTTKNYITFLKHFAQWILDEGIKNPTRDNIRDYQKHLDSYISEKTGKPLEITTKQQYFQVVKTFFRFLENENLYCDITKGIKSYKVQKEVERKRPFTEEEIKTILSSIDTETPKGKRDFAMILLTITGGLRIIELQRANIEDIETIDNEMILYIQGKGRDSKDEYIKIIPEVRKALEEYLETRPNAKESEPLFTSTSNRSQNKRIEETSISRLFKTIFKECGFNSKKLTAHSLRHSSNTILFKTGADIYKVQKHSRHSDISTTTIYLHNYERKEDDSEQAIYNQIFSSDSSQLRNDLIKKIKELDSENLEKIQSLIVNI